MASYKRQRKHGVRAQTITGPAWLFNQEGADPQKPERNRMTTRFLGITASYPNFPGAYGVISTPAASPNAWARGACINAIQPGSLRYQRTGNVVNLLRLHGTFSTLAPATMVDDKIEQSGGRILILFDRQANRGMANDPTAPQGPPWIGGLLANERIDGSATAHSLNSLNLNFDERFITLYDEKWTFPELIKGSQYFGAGMAGITTSVIQPHDGTLRILMHDIDIDLSGLQTVYNNEALDTTNLCSQIASGAIYVYCLTGVVDVLAGSYPIWRNNGALHLEYEA